MKTTALILGSLSLGGNWPADHPGRPNLWTLREEWDRQDTEAAVEKWAGDEDPLEVKFNNGREGPVELQ